MYKDDFRKNCYDKGGLIHLTINVSAQTQTQICRYKDNRQEYNYLVIPVNYQDSSEL